MIAAPPQIPSYAQGFARYRDDPARPKLCERLIGLWAPHLGPTGLALFDWSGYGNHGTLTNFSAAGGWIAGPYGWALNLDGAGGWGHVADAPSLDVTTDLSIVLRLRRGRTGTRERFVTKYKTTGNQRSFAFYVDSDDTLRVLLSDNGSSVALTVSDLSITDTGWHHVAMTYASGALKFYLDTVENAKTSTETSLYASTADLALFAWDNGASGWFQGYVAGVRMYNRVLTASEIVQDYANPFAVFQRRQIATMSPAIGGPYRVAAGGAWHTGAAAGQAFHTGQTAGQIDGRCG